MLTLVCDFLTDVLDVLSFALTSSALRPAATTRLLSMRPIRLTAGASVRRFHSFLFADAPARALWIDLESNERRTDADIAKDTSLLFDVLTACPHLGRISLVFEHYAAGDPDNPRIRDTLAALPNLRTLTLYGPSEDALPLVANIRSPLRALSLHQCSAGETEFWYPAALEQYLSHLAPTLDKLGLYELFVDPDTLQALEVILGLPGLSSGSGSGATHCAPFRAVYSLRGPAHGRAPA